MRSSIFDDLMENNDFIKNSSSIGNSDERKLTKKDSSLHLEFLNNEDQPMLDIKNINDRIEYLVSVGSN
jgi:hypothetical protein